MILTAAALEQLAERSSPSKSSLQPARSLRMESPRPPPDFAQSETVDAAVAVGVPEDGSLYFDYLGNFPVGVSMSMVLKPDEVALPPRAPPPLRVTSRARH